MDVLNKKEFPVLTGIRFLAASFVFLYHYAHELFADGNQLFLYYFFRQFNIGVNLFFVLSGFLITHRYFEFSLSRKSFRIYIVKRVARIFPLYYLVLFIQVFLIYLHRLTLPDFLTVFLNITLLKGLSANFFYSILTQSWSLTVEEMFYLYAPVCFYLVKAKKFFMAQIPLLLGIGFLLVFISGYLPAGTLFESNEFMLASTFFGRSFEFFIGIFLAFLIRRQPPLREGILFTAGGCVLFFVLLGALGFYAYGKRIEKINEHVTGIVLFNFLIPLSIGLFLYGLLLEQSLIKRLLSTRPLILLGKSSYAFYLIHIGMIAEVLFFQITSNIFFLYVSLQILSIMFYKWFEKPVYFSILRNFGFEKKQ